MPGRADTDPVDVLVLSSFPPGVGGGELQTREQLLRMVRRGRRVHVIDLEPRHGGPALEDDEGIVVHRVRAPRAPVLRACAYHATIASLAWRLGRRARVAQINHLGTGMITAAPLLAALSVPRALVVWGSAAPGAGPFGSGWRHRAARWVARRQTAVVALSTATCRNLEAAGFGASNMRFIPNGVDTERFRPGAPGDAPWTPPQGWPATGPVVVTVSRLVPAKGLDVMLRAWRIVAEAVPAARLVIVALIGSRPDVPQILRSSHVYVSSSRTEGMSNSLLEGLASGLPLVATRVGGAEDTVEAGVNGLLVRDGDPEGLAAALREVLSSDEKRQAMGAASRRLALERFALEKIVDRYLDLFREMEPPA
jgi:glycosyltransferase involved in cell wall biosynthesis